MVPQRLGPGTPGPHGETPGSEFEEWFLGILPKNPLDIRNNSL
jgi:hypothetical protein